MATKKRNKPSLLPAIHSLQELRNKCSEPATIADRYQRLAILAATNLGGAARDHKRALQELEEQAGSLEYEYNELNAEQITVDEINYVRDIEAEGYKL